MKRVSFSLAFIALAFITAVATNAQSQAQKSATSQTATPVDKKQADCGCEANIPADALAIVNGVKVSQKEVDEQVKDRIKAIQDQVIEARKREVDLQINSLLLEAEAKRLGITTEKLLDREINQKIKQPTEAEARAFFDQNRSRIQGEFADSKDEIINYMRTQRQQEEAKRFAERLRGKAQVKVRVENATPPETEADRARVFAIVNGKEITSAAVEDALKLMIFIVQDQVYVLRKGALEVKINDLLLEAEARRRNLTASALFDAEVLTRIKPVTEEDARRFFQDNKSKLNGTFEELRAQIVQYLQNRAHSEAAGAYAEQLRKAATVSVFLTPPEPPVFDIAIAGSASKGAANAPVTIVEFTDFECPSCAVIQPVLEELVKQYADKVKLVARNFPLEQHKKAFKAAEAAEAALEQGKYWEYTALLFKNQKSLEVDNLKEYAGQLGLDRKRFDAALDSGKFAEKVKRDLADGEKIGVNSTPTVFINGRRAREKSAEALKAAIEAILKGPAKTR